MESHGATKIQIMIHDKSAVISSLTINYIYIQQYLHKLNIRDLYL